MRDYMTALQRRFHIASEQSVKLKREAETAYDTLHDTLSREQQNISLQHELRHIRRGDFYKRDKTAKEIEAENKN